MTPSIRSAPSAVPLRPSAAPWSMHFSPKTTTTSWRSPSFPIRSLPTKSPSRFMREAPSPDFTLPCCAAQRRLTSRPKVAQPLAALFHKRARFRPLPKRNQQNSIRCRSAPRSSALLPVCLEMVSQVAENVLTRYSKQSPRSSVSDIRLPITSSGPPPPKPPPSAKLSLCRI